MFGVIVLLEVSSMAKSQLPGKGNQGFLAKMSWYLVDFIYGIDLNKISWTSGSKKAPKHQ